MPRSKEPSPHQKSMKNLKEKKEKAIREQRREEVRAIQERATRLKQKK